MTKRERNKYLMIKLVQGVIKEFTPLVQAGPALLRCISDLNTRVINIDNLESEYQTVSKGTTAYKNTIREKLEEELDTMCNVLSSYSKEIDNMQISAIVDLTESEIADLRDSVLSEKAKEINKFLVDHATPLLEYDVSPESATEFQGLIKEYDNSLEKHDNKANASVVARGHLKKAFSAVDEILKERLDKQMKTNIKKNPLFYNSYIQARLVKNLGVRHDDTTDTPSAGQTAPATASA